MGPSPDGGPRTKRDPGLDAGPRPARGGLPMPTLALALSMLALEQAVTARGEEAAVDPIPHRSMRPAALRRQQPGPAGPPTAGRISPRRRPSRIDTATAPADADRSARLTLVGPSGRRRPRPASRLGRKVRMARSPTVPRQPRGTRTFCSRGPGSGHIGSVPVPLGDPSEAPFDVIMTAGLSKRAPECRWRGSEWGDRAMHASLSRSGGRGGEG